MQPVIRWRAISAQKSGTWYVETQKGRQSKMAKLTRRTLLKQTSVGAIGAATIGGVVAAAPHLAGKPPARDVAPEQSQSVAAQTGLVVHVRDFSTGQVSVMHGEKEIVLHDPALVEYLFQAVV
jgi:hypothetical protein